MKTLNVIAGGVALALALNGPAWAAGCSGSSPAHTVALVELYTSEGCSSCPPADRWLRSLGKDGNQALAPLALHVDYWDYIGWKDPFARPVFTARQQRQSSLSGRSFVYTPQVFLAGKDYRGWSSAKNFARDLSPINAMPARAAITIVLEPGPGGTVLARASARVERPADGRDALLHLTTYRNGLSTRVTAGENAGEQLFHDYVARDWSEPVPVSPSGTAAISLPAHFPTGAKAGTGGALAFVQNRVTGEVLQAYALPLCDGAG